MTGNIILLVTAAIATANCPVLAAEIVFQQDVKPIFQKRCWPCHGPEQQNGSLRLDKRERAMVAGRGEPAIAPGASEQSLLYRRISGNQLGPQMPLTGPLSAQEVATIKAWIDQGAKWPDEPKPQPAWHVDSRLDSLFDLLRNGKFATVREGIESDRSLLRARNTQGTTLLMQVVLYGSTEQVRWLLAQGADPNVADAGGQTALMRAIEDVEKVRALLDSGAHANDRSAIGQTALLIALDQASGAGVVKLLLEHGAKATPDQGTDPLVEAARNGDPQTMQLLAHQRGGKYPPAALTGAAFMDCLPCVQLVLQGGVSKRLAGNALRVAATTARLELLKTLLAAGADVNAKDGVGTTALMRAAYSDYLETDRVKLLIAHGADVNARTEKGETALGIAKRKGATKVVALLAGAGAKE